MKPSLLERALDMLDYGLLIIDGRGRLEYKNRAAGVLLKSTASPLVVSSGSIRGRSKSLRFELRQAIARVCATRRLSALAAPQAGPMPLRMVLTPIALRNSVGAAIWMVNVQPQMLPDERTLCLLFGLSRAEARLGLALLTGQTPRECAHVAGVGVATVRSHLHNMFAKTGARRQAELVALLARIPPLGFGLLPGAV